MLGVATGVDFPELFAAIALHDWPHFESDPLADSIVIGEKTAEEQRLLTDRLCGELPLSPLAQLVVLMHWQRLSNEKQVKMAIDERRVDMLLRSLGIQQQTAARMDQWTNLCDTFAFFLSRGEEAEADTLLQDPRDPARSWRLGWKIAADRLDVQGGEIPLEREICLLTYASDGYPDSLTPRFHGLHVAFA